MPLREGPEVEAEIACLEAVGVIKQVDITPSYATSTLKNKVKENKITISLKGLGTFCTTQNTKVQRLRTM